MSVIQMAEIAAVAATVGLLVAWLNFAVRRKLAGMTEDERARLADEVAQAYPL